MNLPLEFIAFGITNGKMYHGHFNIDTFISTTDSINMTRNSVVYGALFLCKDFDFYIRILDSYHLCSLSTLLRNHPCDELHRTNVSIRPIYFNTLDELQYLKYIESNDNIVAQTYIANIDHPKIKQRMDTSNNTHRITSGINADNFKKLFWEVIK